jgi:hypothetical protein
MTAARPLVLAALAFPVAAHPGTAVAVRAQAPAPVEESTRREIEVTLRGLAPTLRPEPLSAALTAWEAQREQGTISGPLLTVIDYGLPSVEKRLWVFDLESRRLLHHELVAHGRNTGENLARSFSNEDGSHKSSLGAFVTGATYEGRNGYSLRLRGIDARLNDRAEARAIVVHGAPYVSEEFARRVGRLGRSHGCPALRLEIARTLIDEIKGGSLLYAWHPDLVGEPAGPGASAG